MAPKAATTTGENPKLAVVESGHLHITVSLPLGPIWGFQAGCFEGQTNYLKRRSLFPQVGGWKVELTLTDSGLIQRCKEEWIRYTEIVDDFQNYPQIVEVLHRSSAPEAIEALFVWEPSEV